MREVTPLLVVDDVMAAVRFYTERLGFAADLVYPEANPVFATVKCGNARFMFEAAGAYSAKGGVEPVGGARGEGVELYVTVSGDIDGYFNKLKAAGVSIARDIFTTDYGMRQFTIRDLSGYVLTFIKHLGAADPK